MATTSPTGGAGKAATATPIMMGNVEGAVVEETGGVDGSNKTLLFGIVAVIFLLIVGICIFVFMLSAGGFNQTSISGTKTFDASESKSVSDKPQTIAKIDPLEIDLMDANFDSLPEVTVTSGATIFKGFLLDNTKNVKSKDKVIGPSVYTKGASRVFLNIPYASAPGGKQFDSSHWFADVEVLKDETASLFINDRKYRKFGTFCAQGQQSRHVSKYTAFGMKMGEMECLTLNIFASADETSKNLPVYVIVHGGSLNKGSAADFGIRGLISGYVSRGVIVVTMNYRLGALGFLTYPDNSRSVKSLRGLMDVAVGLQFVQKYIEVFGGDPKRITLGGFSAGGCLAEVLAITAQTSEEPEFQTFNRIVSHSGPYQVCSRFGGLFTFPLDEMFFANICPNVTDPVARVNCLHEAKLEKIATVGHEFPFGFFLQYPDYQGKIRDPASLNATLGYKIDYLLGITRDEATFFEKAIRKLLAQAQIKNVPEPGLEFLRLTFRALAAKLSAQDPTISKKMEMINKLAESYFTGKYGNNKAATFQFFTDLVFKSAVMQTVRQFSAFKSKLQVFMFAHSPPFSPFYSDGLSPHESDLAYAYMPDYIWTVLPADREADIRTEAAVADKMQEMLVKFIITGKAIDQLKNDPIEKGDVPYLKFDAMTVENSLMPAELENMLSAFRSGMVSPPKA